MEKLLEIKNLRVQYNTDEAVVYALNNFSLELNKGEILGVVGETGAGKTTMALSIMQLLPDHVAEITGGRRYVAQKLAAPMETCPFFRLASS
mgnify:CR=1 FL=1